MRKPILLSKDTTRELKTIYISMPLSPFHKMLTQYCKRNRSQIKQLEEEKAKAQQHVKADTIIFYNESESQVQISFSKHSSRDLYRLRLKIKLKHISQLLYCDGIL